MRPAFSLQTPLSEILMLPLGRKLGEVPIQVINKGSVDIQGRRRGKDEHHIF